MKITYRPEIDGLRAIAVLAVILYHAKFPFFNNNFFSGGFLGVDIFFVISGYLITSIILKELFLTGNFSFFEFYQRRIRRIIPALFFVILGTLPLAWFFLTPASLEDFSKSILFSLGFSSNFYFWHSGLQYGAENSFLKPFLHTWSLSVEEQYYIIFPFLLFFIFKFFKNFIYIFLIFGLVLSLLIANWGSENYPSFNFYILPTRGWELLTGSLISYYEMRYFKFNKNKLLNELALSLGLLLITFSFFYFDDEMRHPSFITVFPILGVCLILYFSSGNEVVSKLLSTKLIVGCGLISYSLYLWHFPILAFDRIIDFSNENIFRHLLIWIFIFSISILSYILIEKPARNKNFKFKKLIKYLIIIAIIIIGFNLKAIFSNGFENRIPFILKETNFNEMYSQRELRKKCNINKIKNSEFCEIGKFDNKVFLIGDSHMVPLAQNLGKRLNDKEYSLTLLYQETQIYFREGMKETRNIFLQDIKNSTFIFGGFLHRENLENLNNMAKSYEKTFKKFLDNGNRIILIYPIPSVKFNYNMEIVKAYKNQGYLKNQFNEKKIFLEKSKNAYDFYNKLKNTEIYRIFPENIMCDKKYCYSVKNNKILISDFDHPSSFLSKKINDEIINIIFD